jgi:hypothetical protein
MSHSLRPPPASPRRSPALRTYLVLAIGSAAGAAEFARPLGTVAAPHRGLAREVARALYPQVAPDELRVLSAAGAPADLVAGALAADGGLALAGG